MYFSDTSNYVIRKVSTGSVAIISTAVGSGAISYCGDFIPATSACLASLSAVLYESDRNVLTFEDATKLRQHSFTTNIVSFLTLQSSTLTGGLAVDTTHAYYIPLSRTIIKLTPQTSVTKTWQTSIVTVAGVGSNLIGGIGYAGDDLVATSAWFTNPFILWSDTQNNIYVTDNSNLRVRRIDGTTTITTTVAGNGVRGTVQYTSVVATSSSISNSLYGLWGDLYSNLYFGDYVNAVIFKVSCAHSVIYVWCCVCLLASNFNHCGTLCSRLMCAE